MQTRHHVENIAEIKRTLSESDEDDVDVASERPATRGECMDMPRPCCFASCPYNLYLDVNENNGSITFNFPDIEITEMKESCALDVADVGGITLEDTGVHLNLTRERIRQIESGALSKLKHDADVGKIQGVDFEALANAANVGHVLSGIHAAKD